MAELGQALGVAAAWFDGDAGAAQWAAAGGDEGGGGGDAYQPASYEVPHWQEEVGSGFDGDQLLHDLQLPDSMDQQQLWGQQGGQEQGGQEQGQQALGGGRGSWFDDSGNLGVGEAAAAFDRTYLLLPPDLPKRSLADDSTSDSTNGGSAGQAATAARGAAGVAAGLQHMHLDDIDAELADSVAPGQLPVVLLCCWCFWCCCRLQASATACTCLLLPATSACSCLQLLPATAGACSWCCYPAPACFVVLQA